MVGSQSAQTAFESGKLLCFGVDGEDGAEKVEEYDDQHEREDEGEAELVRAVYFELAQHHAGQCDDQEIAQDVEHAPVPDGVERDLVDGEVALGQVGVFGGVAALPCRCRGDEAEGEDGVGDKQEPCFAETGGDVEDVPVCGEEGELDEEDGEPEEDFVGEFHFEEEVLLVGCRDDGALAQTVKFEFVLVRQVDLIGCNEGDEGYQCQAV